MYYSGIILPVFIVVACIAVVVWLASTVLFVKAARLKGFYQDGGAGGLYVLALFGTPILVGLYVAALPDRSGTPETSPQAAAQQLNSELPSI